MSSDKIVLDPLFCKSDDGSLIRIHTTMIYKHGYLSEVDRLKYEMTMVELQRRIAEQDGKQLFDSEP